MAISSSAPRLTVCGAAKTVTGSKYLLEAGDKLLIDCGLFQGPKELRLKNWELPPFDAKSIAAVLLTHAHIDHAGYLPALVRLGFKGDVYCTPATRELLGLLLPDAAKLQEEEAEYANQHGSSKHSPARPLFTAAEAEQVLKQVKTVERGRAFSIAPGISAATSCAGHILGSVSYTIDVRGKQITFSGDLGQYNAPILPDPEPAALGELLIIESTYGDRRHESNTIKAQLAEAIHDTCRKGGPLIIPAFAIGRTQTLLFYIAELEREGLAPKLPVYVDSPMAVDTTQIYRRFQFDYDTESQALLAAGKSPMLTAKTVFCRSSEESKGLNALSGPRVIISASGMATGGRILHHLRLHLDEKNATVLFVGYQARGTRGHDLQHGAKQVKIFGQYVPVRAAIKTVSGLSAHADRDELMRWLKSCRGAPRLVKVTHGEEASATSLAQTIKSELGWNASAADYLETIEI